MFQVFLSNTNNLHTMMWFQVFLFNTNNLHTIIWFQVFLSNIKNFYEVILLQVFLTNTNYLHRFIWFRLISLVGRVFAMDPGDRGSIPGRVIRKTLKVVLDTHMLNTQHYKVRIKGKVEQSRERRRTLIYTSV